MRAIVHDFSNDKIRRVCPGFQKIDHGEMTIFGQKFVVPAKILFYVLRGANQHINQWNIDCSMRSLKKNPSRHLKKTFRSTAPLIKMSTFVHI